MLLQQLQVAGEDLLPFHPGTHAPAGEHVKAIGRGKRIPQLLFAAAHDGLAQGMLRQLFGGGGQPVDLLPGTGIRQAGSLNHLRRAVGQGAGLVKGNYLHAGQPLQCVPFPHQKTMLRGVADGRHDGGGGSKYQGAGAEHHQDGHRPDNLPGDEPGKGCRAQGDDHNPGGPAVGDPHDPGLTRVGGLDQPDHPLDGAVLPYLGGTHLKCSKLVHGPAGDLVPRGLIDGEGFPGHHGLVDGGLPGDDYAVYRHAFPGQDAEQVAHLHLFGRDDALLPVPQEPGGLGRQMHQLLYARAGPGHGQFLQQAAQLHDEGHLAGGKVLADGHRGDQGQGHQHIRLDVKGGDQSDDGLQNDGDTAQDNSDPRYVKGKGLDAEQAQQYGGPGDGQQRNVLFDAAQFQQLLQFFHE